MDKSISLKNYLKNLLDGSSNVDAMEITLSGVENEYKSFYRKMKEKIRVESGGTPRGKGLNEWRKKQQTAKAE
jgi:hypothetical protein